MNRYGTRDMAWSAIGGVIVGNGLRLWAESGPSLVAGLIVAIGVVGISIAFLWRRR